MRSAIAVALLAVLLLAGCRRGPGASSSAAHAHQESEVARALEKSGAVLTFDEHSGELVTVSGRGTKLGPEDLRLISQTASIREVDLRDAQFDDQDAKLLSESNSISALNLNATRITNAGLRSLSRMPLEELDIGFCDISDLSPLFNSSPPLKRFNLAGTAVSDSGLAGLRNLKGIRELCLARTAIGDEGMAEISRLKECEVLFLSATRVSDAGLRLVAEMPRLRLLRVAKTAATDEAVESIAKLKGLEREPSPQLISSMQERLSVLTVALGGSKAGWMRSKNACEKSQAHPLVCLALGFLGDGSHEVAMSLSGMREPATW